MLKIKARRIQEEDNPPGPIMRIAEFNEVKMTLNKNIPLVTHSRKCVKGHKIIISTKFYPIKPKILYSGGDKGSKSRG